MNVADLTPGMLVALVDRSRRVIAVVLHQDGQQHATGNVRIRTWKHGPGWWSSGVLYTWSAKLVPAPEDWSQTRQARRWIATYKHLMDGPKMISFESLARPVVG